MSSDDCTPESEARKLHMNGQMAIAEPCAMQKLDRGSSWSKAAEATKTAQDAMRTNGLTTVTPADRTS